MSSRWSVVSLIAVLVGASAGGIGCTERTKEASSRAETASPSDASLTSAQRQRLAPPLQRVLTGDTVQTNRVQPVGDRDGDPVYSVLIVASDAEALRDAGLALTNVRDSVLTARWTPSNIRRAASIEGVRRIRAGTPLQLQRRSR
jgi:hypothetical protein